MNSSVVISGVGLWTPENSISNEELVTSYNAWAEHFNQQNHAAIEAGELEAKPLSSPEFIEKIKALQSEKTSIQSKLDSLNNSIKTKCHTSMRGSTIFKCIH